MELEKGQNSLCSLFYLVLFTTWSLEAFKACNLNYKILGAGTTFHILCAIISVESGTWQLGNTDEDKGQPASAAVPSPLAELGLWLIRGMRKIKMLTEDFGHMEIPMSSVQNTPSGAKCKGAEETGLVPLPLASMSLTLDNIS